LREAACIRALCDAEAEAIRRYGLTNPICVIPNGIDLPVEGPRSHGPTGPHAPFKVLLYLGRIHPKKGLANLIKAWAELQRSEVKGQKSEEWVLAVAGWNEGGHENELKQVADELRLPWSDLRNGDPMSRPSTLFFLGPRFHEAKAAAYRNCDAFILPSLSEGLPMAVLEAWSYGKPVLMTPECNLPEGFAQGAALRIASEQSSITEGLRQLVAAPDHDLSALGRQGRKLVEARFNWKAISSEMRQVFEWVVDGGPRPGSVLS
jgi:poly(glycerol-phosphate) alpha-glucosyltransferase